MVDEIKTTESDRTPRSAESRDKTSRRKPWQPPSLLDAPPPPQGYVYRWIRESMIGQNDPANMSKRIREGWEPVSAKDHPDFEAPTIDSGRYEGVFGVGGLILARIPKDIVEERKAYFKDQTEDAMRAVDNDLLKESQHHSMSIQKPERQSRVTFGGPTEK